MKVAVLASLAVLAIAASGARAASPDASAAEVWRGRSCTPLGRGPGPRGSAVDAIVFGAAAFGSAWLARRRPR